jgi:hypothetical protein
MRVITFIRAAVFGAVMVVATAGPVAAGGAFDSGWYNLNCQTSGGAHGWGYIEARGWVEEVGFSGANYLVLKALWQQDHVDTPGADWFPAYQGSAARRTWVSQSFPNNGASHVLDRNNRFHFQFEGDFTDYWNRIKFTAQAWDERSGPDVLLYQRKFHTPNHAC